MKQDEVMVKSALFLMRLGLIVFVALAAFMFGQYYARQPAPSVHRSNFASRR